MRHECDRLQCERDAIKLERDTLLREKEELQAELNNRNDIIHHLQDHVVSDVFAACQVLGRRGDLMVSVLVPGASGPGSSPGREHCVVFLGKTLNSHSLAFFYPGV